MKVYELMNLLQQMPAGADVETFHEDGADDDGNVKNYELARVSYDKNLETVSLVQSGDGHYY